MTTKSEFIEKITLRKQKLEEVKSILKNKFIGIDEVIDKIIDNISLWYLTPEIQFKPLIISLWGITGVGKTDLVRTLVNLLDFTDKFIEIQMDLKNDFSKNIENYLENSGVDCNEPAILLLDEIQRFRTLDEMGHQIDNKYFNDVWMLLSDGKFQNNSQRRIEIIELLLDEKYYYDRRDDNDGPKETTNNSNSESVPDTPTNNVENKSKNYKFKTSYWTANRFRKILGLKIPVDEIMEMDIEQRMEIMESSLKSSSLNEGKSYEKLLIFISGNLDEAFRMAEDVEDSERDADIYHELSKRINIIHIKNALSVKFKPEQIARFGNNHIIYPCLDKQSYYKIIKMNCDFILDRIAKEHDIKITLSNLIYDIIYRNGVFPTQGVRPVISTVSNILGSNLPYFMYYALINNVNDLYIDFNDKKLFAKIGKHEYSKEIILEIDSIRENKSVDEKTLVVVHELGHALLYALLFNTPPRQIILNSSGFSDGFVINHASIDNKTFIRNQIAIYLAGLVAEEIVFGEEFKSNGAASDISIATSVAGNYVRAYGMDGYVSRIIKQHTPSTSELNYSVDETNNVIENILFEEKNRARDLLNRNILVFKELIRFASGLNRISSEQFITICNEHGMQLIQKNINDRLIYSYDQKLKKFLE